LVDSWLFWQMAGLGPMRGNSVGSSASRISPIAMRDYEYPSTATKEVMRLYGVLERQLAGRSYVCDNYSIADIASWT